MTDQDRKGDAKRAFNEAAPKGGHLSRTFNRHAQVQPQTYSNDIRKFRPGDDGPGFSPIGMAKRYKKAGQEFAAEEKSMLRLKDKFNHRSRNGIER